MTDLAEKYRPKTWKDVVNQDGVVKSLESILAREEGIPPAFLLTGPSGCGKTTMGEIIATSLDVELNSLNYNYYNTSNTRGIDTIREIDRYCRFKPTGNSKKKFYLIDECHELTKPAQNAFLSILERPPGHSHFCLCTTEPNKLLKTIKGRCTQYTLSSFTRVKLVGLLKKICEEEGVKFEPKIYREIADVSDGSARNALKILDQIIDVPEGTNLSDMILDASVQETQVIEICRMMLEGKSDWGAISKALKSINSEPENIRRAIVNYLTAVCLNKKSIDRRLINVITIMSDHNATMYSGLGGLVSLIGLSFSD